MKQFARFVSLNAIIIFSGVSLNTQAADLEVNTFKTNIELQLTRMKAEALANVKYEIQKQLNAPKALYLGEIVESAAIKNELTQYTSTVLNNLENLAD